MSCPFSDTATTDNAKMDDKGVWRTTSTGSRVFINAKDGTIRAGGPRGTILEKKGRNDSFGPKLIAKVKTKAEELGLKVEAYKPDNKPYSVVSLKNEKGKEVFSAVAFSNRDTDKAYSSTNEFLSMEKHFRDNPPAFKTPRGKPAKGVNNLLTHSIESADKDTIPDMMKMVHHTQRQILADRLKHYRPKLRSFIDDLLTKKPTTNSCCSFVGNASFGQGWWLNTKNKEIVPLDQGSMGPHGDHDGWISLGDNAKKLGLDQKKAMAFQVAVYGLDPEENPKFAKFDDFYISPMDFEGDEEFEALFKQEFGVPLNTATNFIDETTHLWRVRQWPDGRVSIAHPTKETVTSKDIENIQTLFDNDDTATALLKAKDIEISTAGGSYKTSGKELAVAGSVKDLTSSYGIPKQEPVKKKVATKAPNDPAPKKKTAKKTVGVKKKSSKKASTKEAGVWRTTDDGSKVFIADGKIHAGGPKGKIIGKSKKPTTNAGPNCGIQKGGFQKGNKCAKGGSGSGAKEGKASLKTVKEKPAPDKTKIEAYVGGLNNKMVTAVEKQKDAEQLKASIEAYVGIGFHTINSSLRGTEVPEEIFAEFEEEAELDDVKGHIKRLDKAIKLSPPLEEDTTLFRGIKDNEYAQLKNLKPGQRIKDKSYLSTSLDIEHATEFADGDDAKVLNILAPKGSKLLPVHAYGESELVLPRGATLEVVSNDKGKLTLRLVTDTADKTATKAKIIKPTAKPKPKPVKLDPKRFEEAEKDPTFEVLKSGFANRNVDFRGISEFAAKYKLNGNDLFGYLSAGKNHYGL